MRRPFESDLSCTERWGIFENQFQGSTARTTNSNQNSHPSAVYALMREQVTNPAEGEGGQPTDESDDGDEGQEEDE